MFNTRASGVLMHLTSIPSRYGVGVMGDETKRFIDKIKEMGFSYWQVLPLDFLHFLSIIEHKFYYRFGRCAVWQSGNICALIKRASTPQ